MRRLGADHKLAAGAATFALLYIYLAWKLPRFVMTTVVDSHVFPIGVGLFLLALSMTLWLEASSGALGHVVYSWAGFNFKALLIHVILVIGFILALEPLGYALSAFAYLFLAAHYMGYPKPKINALVALLFSAGTFYLFNGILNVPLPSGVLEFLGL